MKRRAWKWALAVVAAIALCFGALFWSAQSRATAVFERHDARVKEAIRSLRASPIVRAPLSEPTIAANGWPAFMDVLQGFAAIPDTDLDVLPEFSGDPEAVPDPDNLDAIFEKHAPLIERLRQAGRYREFTLQGHEEGWAMEVPDMSTAIRAAKFLAERSDRLWQKEQHSEALESILLGIGMAHDSGRGAGVNSLLTQRVCESIMVDRVRTRLNGHDFQASHLESFARTLDRLEARRPALSEVLRVEGVLVRRSLVNLGVQGTDAAASVFRDKDVFNGRSYRFLFSRRLVYAGALDELEELFNECQIASTLPMSKSGDAAGRIQARLGASKNEVVQMLVPAIVQLDRLELSRRMEWTLMRTAVAVARFETETGKSPGSPADLVPKYLPALPSCVRTGKPLVYQDGNVWWVGRNGIDDGGKPGLNDDALDDNGDVVWTVKRK